jgi:hypothetical protein
MKEIERVIIDLEENDDKEKIDEFMAELKILSEELNEIEAKGEMTPWMQDVITRQAGDIHASFQEILTTGIAGAEVRVSQ